MAEGFKARNLSVLAYANGFTLWHYITPDLAADIDTSGYFADARDMLRVGDFIIATHLNWDLIIVFCKLCDFTF